MMPELIAMMEEYATKAKEITIRTEWFTPQELIAHMINRTASYHMAASSPDNVLTLIAAHKELLVAVKKAVYMLGMLTDSQLYFRQPSGQTASEVFHELEDLTGGKNG